MASTSTRPQTTAKDNGLLKEKTTEKVSDIQKRENIRRRNTDGEIKLKDVNYKNELTVFF